MQINLLGVFLFHVWNFLLGFCITLVRVGVSFGSAYNQNRNWSI